MKASKAGTKKTGKEEPQLPSKLEEKHKEIELPYWEEKGLKIWVDKARKKTRNKKKDK